jgi:NADPH:quinone reductase-like Zn-dependent oxidoreductase
MSLPGKNHRKGRAVKAAIVEQAGRTAVYGDFKEPVPSIGENHIAVTAAALSPVVKARASGTHYSSSGDFPIGVGIDGVGHLDDGRRVHFFLPRAPYGSMAEKVVVPSSQCTSVPDGLDDIMAAAIAIPGMSSWVALKERAKFVAGEIVLVNGATGASGRLAVQVARYLGAKKIIATGRQAAALQSIKALGADETILLIENRDALVNTFKEQFAGGVDVVLDYLWGQSTECLLTAGSKAGTGAPISFIQIGTAGGTNITLPGAVLRSSPIELMGSGLGSVPINRIVGAIEQVLQAAVAGHFEIAINPIPLSEVEQAWSSDGYMPRVVFTIGEHVPRLDTGRRSGSNEGA